VIEQIYCVLTFEIPGQAHLSAIDAQKRVRVVAAALCSRAPPEGHAAACPLLR